MIKERAFVVEDILAGSIWEIEKMITDACSTRIKEYDLWTETDGLQEVKVYLRLLREIIIQRIRCFPFKSDKAWKCNPRHL